MSKLYEQYLKLKQESPHKVYLFRCGAFYNFLDKDAETFSKIFSLKLLPFSSNVLKCSFPVSRLGYYINELQKLQQNFEIIDNSYPKIENFQDYLNNENLKNIVSKVVNLDLNNITMRESFDILQELQEKLKNISAN